MNKKLLDENYYKSQLNLFYYQIAKAQNFAFCFSKYSSLEFYNFVFDVECANLDQFFEMQTAAKKIFEQEKRQFAIKISPHFQNIKRC